MIESRQREAPQVAHDEQRVLIDRVGMEQVVLHAANDAAEGRNVEPQYAVEIHSTQFMRHAFRRAKNGKEQTVIARVLPKLLVNKVQVSLDQADRIRADAADVRVLLQKQEQLEQCRRLLRKNPVRDGLEEAVLDLEALIERYWRRVGIHQDGFLEEL